MTMRSLFLKGRRRLTKVSTEANKGVYRGSGSTFDSACSLRTFAAPHSVLLLEKPGMPSSVGTEEDTMNIT